ncbi:MAG: exo-alpha-sialidase [Promethearchaeota archaeon]
MHEKKVHEKKVHEKKVHEKKVHEKIESPKTIIKNLIYPIGSIPGRPEAHAAHVIAGFQKDGQQILYCTWFSGTKEGNLDVAIMFSECRYNLNSTFPHVTFEYSKPRVIIDIPDRAAGNPVLFLSRADGFPGELHLWYTGMYPERGKKGGRHKQDLWVYHCISFDGGLTWSKDEKFSPRAGILTKNSVLVLDDGTWLLPLNDEETTVPGIGTRWSSLFAFSHNSGKSWEFSPLYSVWPLGMIQPTVVQLDDGSLFCLCRTRQEVIMSMRSFDNGRTWTEPDAALYTDGTPIPNPNANVHLLFPKKHSSGKSGNILLLAYNPSTEKRDPLSIAISYNGGESWVHLFDLEGEASLQYSYPTMCETQDGLIHVVFTYNRKTIAHYCFNI